MASNIIACRIGSYGQYSAVAYEHLAGLGIRFVETVVPQTDQIEQAAADLQRHGLAASSLHGECDVRRPDTAAQVAAQMPAFAALGTKVFFASVRADGTSPDAVYERLRAAGAVAAQHGVTIVLETHPDLVTNSEVALATMRGTNHPHVRVNFDTANIYFYNQDVDGVEELRRVAAYVGAVHLKDTDGGYRRWHFPALGRGIVKFPDVFRVLDGLGFSGPYTLEIEGIEGEAPSERRVCDRVAESVGYLRGLGRL